jgi:hypothetical protein
MGLSAAMKAAGGGRFTGADFPGDRAAAVMIGQKLQPCFGLIPGLRRELLFGIASWRFGSPSPGLRGVEPKISLADIR